jgi:uncharacterized membrane protein YkvA (DUF1232 family)
MLERLRTWARDLKNDVVALWLAARPIDLIPDFVPVLG